MYPEYVRIDETKYKINTSFKTAIECNRIAEDENISDLERSLAIIYTLFGEEALRAPQHYERLIQLATKYLTCGKGLEENKNEKPDMDFIQDYGYIWASFMSDYNGMDIDKEDMHWWKFNELLNGLSNSELGGCCVLNRVRNLRNFDVSKIKDRKERQKIIDAQKKLALNKNKKENHLTKEQEESMERLNKILGL